jgi:U3 small nucleolar RNA-associated protein 15
MSQFRKVQLKQYPQIQDRETGEAKYWKKFTKSHEDHLFGAPNNIHFSPSGSHDYLVSGSTKVNLYDGRTDAVVRSYTRFEDEVFSAKFRKDGRLFVAGDKTGYLKVFDVQTKAVLRFLKRHTSAVRSTGWTADSLHMLSGSDDRSVKKWDLAIGEVVWENSELHTDYVRCMTNSPVDTNVFVSGGYDHTVALWDTRQQSPSVQLQHAGPVADVMFASSGGLLLSTVENEIKVWDLISGGKLLHTFSNHQKNITSMTMNANSSRLLSCGLDGHVKIYDFQSMQMVHGMKLGSPLMSIAMSPSNSKFVVGFVDGTLQMRNRIDSVNTLEDDDEDAKQEGLVVRRKGLGQSRFYKGAGTAVESTEPALVESEHAVRLKPYEEHLKRFDYQKALDAALRTRNPLVVVTILEELSRRSALSIALSGRDEVSIEPLLAFAARYVSQPRYARLIVQVTNVLLDLYAHTLGNSDAIDELFLKLHRQVRAEVGLQRDLLRVMGALDTVINNSLANNA